MAVVLIQPEITLDTVREYQAQSPRRVCFAYTHNTALKRGDLPYIGAFNIPFHQTIRPIFTQETRQSLYSNKQFGGYWRSLQTEHEYDQVEQFVEKYKELVFMRDRLALSVALSSYKNSQGELTIVGDWEKEAKYNADVSSQENLANTLVQTIDSLPFYREADFLCSIPPSTGQKSNLPTDLVRSVAEQTGRTEVSDCLHWSGQKSSLKNLPLDEKWEALDSAQLQVTCNFDRQSVILVDDMYQSGTTMHYVAMKLIEAGVRCVYGLSLVKARGDSDNA